MNVFGQQAVTATIEGVVTDPNKAAVPGAKVTVKNLDIGLTRDVTTDGSGLFFRRAQARRAHSSWRKQVTRWSFTMPVACMCA